MILFFNQDYIILPLPSSHNIEDRNSDLSTNHIRRLPSAMFVDKSLFFVSKSERRNRNESSGLHIQQSSQILPQYVFRGIHARIDIDGSTQGYDSGIRHRAGWL